MRFYICFFICLLSSLFLSVKVWADIEKDLLRAYKKAKKCYTIADYAGAKEALVPLLADTMQTSLTPYAWFYYGLVAYHEGHVNLAEETFLKIYQEFSDWDQQDEVKYWLAQIAFEKKDYSQALAYLTQIHQPELAPSIQSMKSHFLHQIEDIPQLQAFLNEYPKDPIIAQVLLDKQIEQPYIKQDHELIDRLLQQFTLDQQTWNPVYKFPSIKKERYNVAVFLPFFIHELNYEEEQGNQFVLSLYKGIVAAVEELASQGIPINLYAYDTKKDAATTAALLEQEEVKYMDLIIGPLYANTIPLVAEFARKHQINLFNPLSSNAQVVGNNPFVYLFKPSLETQARQAAWYTQQDSSATKLGIVYGTSAEDSIKAFTYKQYIEQHTNQQVSLVLQLDAKASREFLNMFRNIRTDTTQVERPDLASLSHIYIASQDELIIANVLSALEILHSKPCIIGDEAWIRQNSITLDQLQRLRLRFIAPDYIDYGKESLQQFRDQFYEQFGHYPGYYESVGYDMMLYIGNMLAQHGVYFQQHWPNIAVPGRVFAGFCYGRHHDNQHVPIVKFQSSALVLCEETAVNQK
ncbi:MAG: hypothetical protein ACK4M7_04210 [Burkholderiales bacterium]